MKIEIDPRDPKEVARLLCTFASGCKDVEYDEMVAEVLREHRTIQQKLFGVVIHLIRGFADSAATHGFDARNEWTVERCHEIVKAMDWDHNFRVLPPYI